MRARARLTRTARRAQTREGILRTAHAVFLERGFHGATLDEIAAAAGVTKGAVYSNFDSKADLFLAVYDVRLDERLRRFARARSTTRGLEQLARQDARTLAADDPDGRWTCVMVEAIAATVGNRTLRAALQERVRSANRMFAEAIRELGRRANVDFPHPPEAIAPMGGAVLRGLLLQRLLDPAHMPSAAIEDAFAAFVRGMARPRSRRPARKEQRR